MADQISVVVKVVSEVEIDSSKVVVIGGNVMGGSILWARDNAPIDHGKDAEAIYAWLRSRVPGTTMAALRRLFKDGEGAR